MSADGQEFFLALEKANIPRLRQLIRDGSDVDMFHECGSSALQRCVDLYLYEPFFLLLQSGANPSAANLMLGTTAMHSIFMFQEPMSMEKHAMLDVLLSNDIPLNLKTKLGATALHLAVRNSSSQYVNELIKHGADCSIMDNYSQNALYHAIFRHRYESIYVLLLAGSDINYKCEIGETMLHHCVRRGDRHHEISILFNHGVNYNMRNQSGQTAYDLALYIEDFDTAHVILDAIRHREEGIGRLKG
jgi:serine/threonine-protein phosphatase 6 regulatory ankyrin repeat subunit A/serine/threonine-protein phosphatase 6 regulatory ankyrin repeat subunit B